MTEEKTTEITKETECKCFCKSEGFRNFLITALGTFAGVYMALSLFTAIHKPPMPCRHFMPPMMHMQGQFRPHKHFNGIDKKFYKEFKGEMKEGKKVNAPEIDD